jgi:hypothetical protein
VRSSRRDALALALRRLIEEPPLLAVLFSAHAASMSLHARLANCCGDVSREAINSGALCRPKVTPYAFAALNANT